LLLLLLSMMRAWQWTRHTIEAGRRRHATLLLWRESCWRGELITAGILLLRMRLLLWEHASGQAVKAGGMMTDHVGVEPGRRWSSAEFCPEWWWWAAVELLRRQLLGQHLHVRRKMRHAAHTADTDRPSLTGLWLVLLEVLCRLMLLLLCLEIPPQLLLLLLEQDLMLVIEAWWRSCARWSALTQSSLCLSIVLHLLKQQLLMLLLLMLLLFWLLLRRITHQLLFKKSWRLMRHSRLWGVRLGGRLVLMDVALVEFRQEVLWTLKV
jgi:hypothetical protein